MERRNDYMQLTTYERAEQFLSKAQAEMEKQEVRNSLPLGIALNLQKQSDYYTRQRPYLATVEDGTKLVAAAVMTPPHNLLVASDYPEEHEAFTLLAQDLHTNGWPMPGVLGAAEVALSFAQIWQQLTGQAYREDIRERVFELTQVIPPRPGPGHLRAATLADTELVLEWTLAFMKEAVPNEPKGDPEERRQSWTRRIEHGSIYLWELEDGKIVSLAATTRPVTKVISIGPVYTPPEQRGKGYASRCVAALSQLMLDSGWERCSLFTDLANPTSNSIYQQIGYQPVCDFNLYLFLQYPHSGSFQ
jgi:predicted GNAT family acetyltransferase